MFSCTLTIHRYLLRKKFIEPQESDYSLSLRSLTYLTLPEMDFKRSAEEIEADFINGTHAFYDYASACWALHLQNGISLQPGDKLTHLQETLETFIELHWSSNAKPRQDTKRIQKTLASIQSSGYFDKIIQAVAWARKQSGEHGQGPSPDEALDLWQVTERTRFVLENMLSPSTSEADAKNVIRFYGVDRFKCPRVNCHRYYRGFNTAEERDIHVNKHTRPFLCFISGCLMKLFGYATEDELKEHLFQYHGIDTFGDTDETNFPDIAKKGKPSNNAGNNAGTFQCHFCDKSYTRNHNLKAHIRTHEDVKPFRCSVCGQAFTRRADCDRHQRGHGDKNFICSGTLKDGSTWGCKASFGRADKLADHFRSKAGQKCLRPLILEKLKKRDNSGSANEGNIFEDRIGENADVLLAAGKILPSFGEFLQLCGLDKSVISETMGSEHQLSG